MEDLACAKAPILPSTAGAGAFVLIDIMDDLRTSELGRLIENASVDVTANNAKVIEIILIFFYGILFTCPINNDRQVGKVILVNMGGVKYPFSFATSIILMVSRKYFPFFTTAQHNSNHNNRTHQQQQHAA